MWGRAICVGALALCAPVTLAFANTNTRPPPQPAIASGARTFVAFAGQPAPVRLQWAPLPDVVRYRARWTDADVLVDIELPGTASSFERAEKTPGRHELWVVAIDANGRESAPAMVAVEVVTVSAIAPGADEPTFPSAAAFAIGTKFSSPGLRCRLGGEPGAEVFATVSGAITLACGGEAGQPRVEVPIVIAPVLVEGPTMPIPRERTTTVHVIVASVAPIGDRIDVEAIGDLDLGDAQRTEFGFDVPVTPLQGTPNAGLIVRVGTVELGRVELALADAAPPPPDTTELMWFALDVGGQVGMFSFPSFGSSGTSLGRPTSDDDVLTTAPLFGGHVGFFPTRRVGLELETSLATPGYVSHPGVAAVLVSRAQLAVRAVDDEPYGLRFLGGVDMFNLLTNAGTSQRDTAGAVHWGAAFTIETRPDLWLRLGAYHVITAARDAGYSHCVELQLGVMTRLGRRDRRW